MTRARNSANLASHGNLFVDITNDRTGIGSVVPAQNLHVAGTAGFHADVTLTGDLYNTVWDRSDNSLKFVDNAKAKFGTGGDLEVYHNGTNAYIDNKTNRLWIRNNTAGNTGHAIILQALSGQTSINLMPGGAAELYHANQKKFETTAYGTNTTGTAVNDGLVVAGVATVTTMNVTGVLTYDDVTSIDSVGIITARSNIDCNGNLDVAGTSNFVGDATFNGGAGAVTIPANSDMRFINGTWSGDVSGNVAKIQHHSNILYISGGSSGIYFRENNTNRWFISDGGHFISGADSTYDIGTSGNRVRNGYFDTLYGDGSNLTGIAADKIFEGNSSVEVIDTGTGKIDVIADGSYVSRFQKVNGNRTYMLVGNPQAVSNDYGTNNGHLIVLGNTNAEPATLRLFGWGAGLSDGTVNNRIEFASQQSGSGGQTFAKIETVVRGSSDNSSDMTFHTASSATVSEKLRITSAGKVGINESSPLGKLHVKTGDSGVSAVGSSADELVLESSTNAGMSILSATNGEGAINFGDSGDNNIGKLVYSHADNSMQFKTNDTERLRIISGGSIGIGIASPQRLLHQHISNSNATYHAFTNSTTGSGVHDGMVIGISGAEEAIFWNYEATPMRFATSGAEQLRIDANGNMALGKGSASSTNYGTNFQIHSSGTNGAALHLTDGTTGSGTGDGFHIISTSGHAYLWNRENAHMIFATNGTERVRIMSNGRVGFGNNNPQFIIHTEGSGNNGGVRIENSHTTTTVSGNTAAGAFPHNLILSNYSGSGTADNRMATLAFDIPATANHANAVIAYQATASNGAGDLQFWLENGNTINERARFTAAGQFLVGATSSTGARVIVQQNSNDTNPLDQQTCADSSGLRLQNYSFSTGRFTALSMECANASSVQSASIIAQSVASGTAPDIIFATRNSNTTNEERFRINSNGKVGINSTSPAHPLDVFGNIRSHQQTPSLYLQTTANTAESAIIRFGDAGSFQRGSIQYDFSGDNHLRFKMGGAGNNVERLTLKGTNGYLGINDNNPANTLVVQESSDNNPSIAMYRQSTGGDIAALIWKTSAGNQAMINYRGGGGNVGMQFYLGGTSSGAERVRFQASNFKEIIFPQQSGDTFASRVYFTEVLANAQTYVKFATVTGPSFRTHIKMSTTSTIGNVVTNAEFDIQVGHYQDIFVTSRSLDYTQTAIKIISDANQNFDLYIRRSGGANGSQSSNHKIAIHPQLFEQVTFNSTVNYSSVTHEHGTHAGTMRLTATGGPNANIHAQGSITGSSKNFSIPHPLSSLTSTKKLVHASIEGPQLDLIYRGKVTLSSGSATVNIDTVSGMSDGTFVALNRDVQCFTTNETGWSAVKGSVSGNLLTITAQDSSSTDTISWMVVGERQDDTIKSSNITDDSGNLIVEKPLEEDYDTSHKHSSYPT